MTPLELHYALKTWNDIQDSQFKIQMEATRLIIVHLWNSAGKSLKKKEFDPHKILPFTWDKVEKKKQTVEEMKSIMFAIAGRQNYKMKK